MKKLMVRFTEFIVYNVFFRFLFFILVILHILPYSYRKDTCPVCFRTRIVYKHNYDLDALESNDHYFCDIDWEVDWEGAHGDDMT